jgi:hypothetical protein
MITLFVAKSAGLQKWAGEVGLTKHVYKFGLSVGEAAAAVAQMNDARYAGRDDWKLIRKASVEALDEATAFRRIAARETGVDPTYYPQIKGATGIFKIKPTAVENYFLVKKALAGDHAKDFKVTPSEIADYLLQCASE